MSYFDANPREALEIVADLEKNCPHPKSNRVHLSLMSTKFAHVTQPNDYTCGAAVVSIVTGAPLAEVIAEVRPTQKRGTPHARIIGALRARGVLCADRFVSIRGKSLPLVGVVRILFPGKQGHVVVKNGNTWFDPLLKQSFTGMPPANRWGDDGSRITSFLEILFWV